MKTKLTLFLFAFIASIGLYAQVQTYNLTVCGYIQSPDSTPYYNVATMNLFANGALISTQTDSMNGSPQICFQPVTINDAIGNGINYTATITIAGCTAISQSGVLNSTQMINIPLSLCTTNCGVSIEYVYQGGATHLLQANPTGVAPFTYLWSGGSNASSILLAQQGIYNLYVTDATGCVSSASYNTALSGYISLALYYTSTQVMPFVFNGHPPFTYNWSNGATTSTIIVNDVTPTTYCVTITDAIGATITICDTVGNCQASINQSTTSPQNYLQAYSIGFPHTYLWSTGDTTQNIYPSQNGTYSVVITDVTGCASSATYNYVYTPFCGVNVSSIPTSNTSYQLTANPIGMAPFTYVWYNNGVAITTPYLNVTTAGYYCCTVTDAAGCISYDCDTVSFSNNNCQTTITNTSSTSFPASLTATSTGVAPFTYSWTDTSGTNYPSTNSMYFPTNSGTYCCMIIDANGCSSQNCYTYFSNNICQTTITSFIPPNVPPNTIMGLVANTTNGTAPYHYDWYLNGVLINDSTNTITVSQSGYYSVLGVDGNGCTSTDSIYMNLSGGNCTANIAWIANPIGGITFTANANGTAPYSYNWSTGSTSQSIVSTQAGAYSVTITDALGCTSIASIIDSISSNGCTASLTMSSPILGIPPTLTAIGNGAAPLTYSWTLSGIVLPTNAQSINPNGIGTYCVLITDANGCTAQACYTINGGNCFTNITDTATWNVHILNANTSGVSPFTYQWYLNNAPMLDTTSAILPSQTGTYIVVVTDASGCTSTDSYYFNYTACLPSTSLAFGLNSEVVSISAGSTGVAPYTYSWTLNGLSLVGGQTVNTSINGTYCYTVTDANGCSVSDCYTAAITPQGNCTAFFTSTPDSLYLPNSNMALIDFTSYPNGSPQFSYLWTFSDGTTDTGANPQHLFIASQNMWAWASLTITDASGCVSVFSNSIILPIYQQNCTAYFTETSSYSSSAIGEVSFQNLSSSTASSTIYSWNFGDGSSSTQQNPTHSFAINGYYNVILTINDNGCISSYSQLVYIDLSWWGNNPYGGNCTAGYILVPASGVNGIACLIDISQVNNPSYMWNSSNGFMSNSTTPFFTLSGLGTYTLCVSVTDTLTGCSDTFCDSLIVDSLGNVFKTSTSTFLSANASVGIAVIASPKSTNATGIAEISKSKSISIQPNPANDFFTLKLSATENTSVNIIDVTGSIVREFKINSNASNIDVSSLSNGTYFVKVISEKNNETQKLIINH